MSLAAAMDRVGLRLVEVGCGYEVVALQVAKRWPDWSPWVPPLSRLVHRYRRHRVGMPVAAGLSGWLLWHLWVQA